MSPDRPDHDAGLPGGFPLGRISGIPVRLDWSLILIFWLLAWGMATNVFPAWTEGHSDLAYWTAATVTAVAFLASLFAHELSHSLVAQRRGITVRSISLWLFGGIATLEGEAHSPGDEFAIAAAGPGASIAIGAGALATGFAFDALGVHDLAVAAVVWLGSINLILAVFNLAPAAPLDGGRLLRAWLWKRRGDRTSAALSATRAGQTFGLILIALGVVEFALGAGVGGLWFVFLGWFVRHAARDEELQIRLVSQLAGVRVADVMTPAPITAPATATVDEVLHDFVLRHRCSAFPLTSPDGHVVGLVTLQRLRDVPAEERTRRAALDVAWPLDAVVTSTPDEPLVDLLRRLDDRGDGRALVFVDGRLAGIVSPTDVRRVLQIAGLTGGPTDRS